MTWAVFVRELSDARRREYAPVRMLSEFRELLTPADPEAQIRDEARM